MAEVITLHRHRCGTCGKAWRHVADGTAWPHVCSDGTISTCSLRVGPDGAISYGDGASTVAGGRMQPPDPQPANGGMVDVIVDAFKDLPEVVEGVLKPVSDVILKPISEIIRAVDQAGAVIQVGAVVAAYFYLRPQRVVIVGDRTRASTGGRGRGSASTRRRRRR